MHNASELAVERVVAAMRNNLGEPLTIDDMARVAMFSKFHFSRMFQRVTGVSPGRFLSALRLQEAKQLLVSTSYNVADISLRVGYTSVGTFSSRFTKSVGLSPTTYRRLGGFTSQIPQDETRGGADTGYGTVKGTILSYKAHQPNRRQLTFIGLFPDRIPEGRPVSCVIMDHPGPFVLDKVPRGSWYLLSHAVVVNADEDMSDDPPRSDLSVATHGPLTIRPGAEVDAAEVRLKPIRSLDPPVLLALLDVRKAALERAAARAAATAAMREAVQRETTLTDMPEEASAARQTEAARASEAGLQDATDNQRRPLSAVSTPIPLLEPAARGGTTAMREAVSAWREAA